MTLREIMDRTLKCCGRRRFYLHIPFWLAKLGAPITLPLPTKSRPLTLDQICLIERDNVVSQFAEARMRTLSGLGIEYPHATISIVPSYLERFHRSWPIRALSVVR
jgi:hypothetical protein